MRIQHNIAALNSYRNLTNNNSAVAKNLEKLSSGYRINRAGDDAAGLAISEKMRAQITGLQTAQKNANDGISLVQTAEGALSEVHSMLNRMVELATQSANGTYDNETDRVQLQKELDQLRTEINRIADSSNFNGIKLFDGSLSGADITTSGMTTSQIDMAKGVEVVQGTNGGGSKGEYTINLDSALSDGDVLTINFGGKTGTDGTATLALTYGSSAAATATTGNIEAADTLNGQASNIAKALKANSAVASNFDIEVNGNSITLKSKVEGNDAATVGTVTSASITTQKAAAQDGTNWKATAGQNATDGVVKFTKLAETGGGGGMNISAGDILKIDVKLGSGKTVTVEAEAGKDFDVADTNLNTYKNFADFLNNKATFADDDSTVVDESKMKFGDLFTVATVAGTNTYGLTFTQKSGLVKDIAATQDTITITNTKPDGTTFAAGAGSQEAATPSTAADSTAAKFDMVLDTTNGAANLGIGDKLTLEGRLTDGRTFKIEVEAGKDFKVGKTYANAMDSLKALLESDSFQVELKNEDGSAGGTVKGSEIFGANAEIQLANTGTFTSNNKGTMASQITNATLTPGEAASVSSKLKNGEQQSSADSVITLTEGVSYGAIVEVGGKKYELVKSAGDVSNGQNQAVVVDDITDTASAAKALSAAIKRDLGDADYSVTASNNKVTVSTKKVGSTAQAISASASGDKTTQVEFTLDPTKMKAGSTVTINGQTYEFINKGGKASDKTYEAIEVTDFSKETSSTLGSALAKLANAKNDASVTVDADGKVTVRGLVNSDNKIVTPTVKFDGGTSGLTLQIGDTAEDFNKMTVSIYNMHTADMGIGDIRIDTQDAAADAVDKIKAAINYVSDVRGTLGATQNRLDHTINNLSVQAENITAAESRIRDVDMAEEMMAYTKNNILVQAAQAMLAQANQVPQGVLQLLQ